VLSTQLENGIYRVVQVYQWSFLTRPVALILLAIVAISLGTALWYREHGRVLAADGVHSDLGRLPQVVFFAVVFSATAYALIQSFEWTYAAALFPRSVAIVTLLLLVPLGLVLLIAKSPSTAFYESEREEFSADVEQHSNEYFLLWLIGYVGIIALIGFALGSAVFVYVFMWRKAQVSLLTCVLSAGCVFALLQGLNFWLGITYVDGLLQTLDLPWPLN
jgi:putative tricarboxylic transport membrane protein